MAWLTPYPCLLLHASPLQPGMGSIKLAKDKVQTFRQRVCLLFVA